MLRELITPLALLTVTAAVAHADTKVHLEDELDAASAVLEARVVRASSPASLIQLAVTKAPGRVYRGFERLGRTLLVRYDVAAAQTGTALLRGSQGKTLLFVVDGQLRIRLVGRRDGTGYVFERLDDGAASHLVCRDPEFGTRPAGQHADRRMRVEAARLDRRLRGGAAGLRQAAVQLLLSPAERTEGAARALITALAGRRYKDREAAEARLGELTPFHGPLIEAESTRSRSLEVRYRLRRVLDAGPGWRSAAKVAERARSVPALEAYVLERAMDALGSGRRALARSRLAALKQR